MLWSVKSLCRFVSPSPLCTSAGPGVGPFHRATEDATGKKGLNGTGRVRHLANFFVPLPCGQFILIDSFADLIIVKFTGDSSAFFVLNL